MSSRRDWLYSGVAAEGASLSDANAECTRRLLLVGCSEDNANSPGRICGRIRMAWACLRPLDLSARTEAKYQRV